MNGLGYAVSTDILELDPYCLTRGRYLHCRVVVVTDFFGESGFGRSRTPLRRHLLAYGRLGGAGLRRTRSEKL